MAYRIVGTAGHVDHGKTTLIRALTGTDTDRLPEEKRRGISIELGFARCPLPSGEVVGVVDVPGHERFIKQMVAGASGIDLVLLVVAADEGVMPQTREHLDILQLLGLERGLVALTKVDLVEADWRDLVAEEIADALRGSFLEGAPILPVSAVTGEGLDALRETLAALLPGTRERDVRSFPRLPIDRVFSVAGFGTVVTGTLAAGTIREEDRLELLPAGTEVRVRQLQVHGERVGEAAAGQRVAVNLTGVERSQVRRGDLLAAPGAIRPSTGFAGRVVLLPGAPRPLRNEERIRIHAGTREIIGRALLLDREELEPGEEGWLQFKSESPLALASGDRFIVRTYSPMRTIGGGTVLDPVRRYKRHNPQDLARLQARGRGALLDWLPTLVQPDEVVTLSELGGRAGVPAGVLREEFRRHVAEREGRGEEADWIALDEGTYWITRSGARRLREEVESEVERYLARHPLRAGMPREEVRRSRRHPPEVKAFNALLAWLAREGAIELSGEAIRLPGRSIRLSPGQAEARARVLALYAEAGLTPPSEAQALALCGPDGRELLGLLLEEGALVKVEEGLLFEAGALARAGEAVQEHLAAHGRVTVAELRDLLGISRKYAVPLAEYFDRIRLTRRQGDYRVLFRPAASAR